MLPRLLTPLLFLIFALLASAQAQVVTCPSGGQNCVPVVVTGGTGTALPVSVTGAVTTGQPSGTPVGNAFSGADTTTQAATLPATAGKTTYICGFTVSGLGATGATTVNVTVATLVGSTSPTYSYVFPAGAAVVATSVNVTYSPCIPSNTVNSTVVVTVPGAAGNTATQINAWGFQL